MIREEVQGSEDESFGPGTDLVVSLFAMLLIVAVLWWYQGRLQTWLKAYAHARQLDKFEELLHQEIDAHARTQQALNQMNMEQRNTSEKLRTQLYEFRDSVNGAPYFEQNDRRLTGQAVAALDAEVGRFVGALRGGAYNQIQIIGYASAESAKGNLQERQRRNFALSLARATAVADHLYNRGIPYECISVSGFGRSHSRVLASWLSSHPGEGIRDWDEHGQYSSQVEDEELARERRVEIWGIWHPDSQCDFTRGW